MTPELSLKVPVASFDAPLRAAVAQLRVIRSPSCQAIYIPVVHAKSSGDEHGVVNLQIGRVFPRAAITSASVTLRPLLAMLRSFFSLLEIGAESKSLLTASMGSISPS